MIKIYHVPDYRGGTREAKFIRQGLVNNPRIELVDSKEESDFIFQFYYRSKRKQYYPQDLPPKKTVVIDYSDKVYWLSHVKCFAYFKRSWVAIERHEGYTTKAVVPRASHLHPLALAIMDEAIINEDMKRDIALSCPLRVKKNHSNRTRVLEFLKKMDRQGNIQMGPFNRGKMGKVVSPEMKDYFRMLKRSRIVVTCNPTKWEGDHRTWEAFANGALVFVDRMWTPTSHPLVDGEHCIFYDLSDTGLQELRAVILYYLKHTTEAETIAKAGHEFTMKYHRASNRIDEILDVITANKTGGIEMEVT